MEFIENLRDLNISKKAIESVSYVDACALRVMPVQLIDPGNHGLYHIQLAFRHDISDEFLEKTLDFVSTKCRRVIEPVRANAHDIAVLMHIHYSQMGEHIEPAPEKGFYQYMERLEPRREDIWARKRG